MAKQQRHPPGECLPAGHHLRILNPVADRRNPGSSTRVSSPSAICAAGSAPVTSASPPVLTAGTSLLLHVKLACMLLIIQPQRRPATGQYFLCRRTRFFPQMGSYLKFVQHFFGNQNDAFFRTIKASRILNGIFANHRPLRITHPRSITQRLILQSDRPRRPVIKPTNQYYRTS